MSDPVEALASDVLQIAAAMARGTYVCEKPHRNGEANPHVHFDDRYIATARYLSDKARAIRAESAGTPPYLEDVSYQAGFEDGVSTERKRAESAGTRTYTQEQHDEAERQLRDCHDRLARSESAGTGLDEIDGTIEVDAFPPVESAGTPLDVDVLAAALREHDGPQRASIAPYPADRYYRQWAESLAAILARLSSSDTER